jgi:hypothetical protein
VLKPLYRALGFPVPTIEAGLINVEKLVEHASADRGMSPLLQEILFSCANSRLGLEAAAVESYITLSLKFRD